MKRSLATSLLLACSLAAPVAFAQPAPAEAEARAHFARGVALYAEANAGAALAEFERAYALLGRRPSLLFNIAVTQEALGRYVEALASMREFAERAPPAAVAPHRVEVDAALVRLPTRIGTLRVLGELPGLAVLVDGDARPLDAARAGLPVSAGVRRVTLRAPGHLPRELEVRVAGGESVGVEVVLEPERSTLAVSCATPDATVRVDGETVGTTPLPSPVEVATGRHRVEITRDGYAPFASEVDARGAGARVEVALVWASPITSEHAARLAVTANESGLVTALDGRRFGEGEPVPAGRHVLRVTRGSFLPWEREVTLRPGEAARVHAWLEPTPSFRRGYLDGVRTRRAVALSFAIPGAALTVAGAVLSGVFGAGYADADARVTAAFAAVRSCEAAACADGRVRVAAFNAAADDRYDARVGLTVGVGVAIVGAAALVTGIVLWTRAGSLHRFDPPGTIRF
ncbi:MAG: PEGA domain-containing protein [Polyangiales bacterium]